MNEQCGIKYLKFMKQLIMKQLTFWNKWEKLKIKYLGTVIVNKYLSLTKITLAGKLGTSDVMFIKIIFFHFLFSDESRDMWSLIYYSFMNYSLLYSAQVIWCGRGR